MSLQLDQRQARPYPPARVQLNGQFWPEALFGDLVVDWVHRDRLLQQDVLVPWMDAGVGPEPGTTYQVTVFDGATQVLQETVSGNQVTVNPGYEGEFTIEVAALRDGLQSWQAVRHTFNYTVTEPRAAEDGTLRRTEEGQTRSIE